jgi:alpha-beta hydrolase superfamily lysophospholipase
VRATARHHNVDATILPGLAHLLMLEPEWQQAAKALEAWIRTLD